jgi:hypothetical protein
MSQPQYPPYPQGPAGPPSSAPAPAQAPVPTTTSYVAPAQPPAPAWGSADQSRHRHHEHRRGGAVSAGVWLIALGLVFLVRDWAGWSWSEAWPLFIVAGGSASLVASLFRRASLDAGSWSLVWPIAWIGIGLVVLAATTGNLGVSLADLLRRWWPVALIAVGIWFLVAAVWPGRRRALESLTLPLGAAPVASIRLRFGGGELEIARVAPGSLLAGTFQGGVRYRTHGPDAAELEPDTGRGWPMGGATFRWSLGLTGEKPLDLRIDTGASRARIDLVDLLVRDLELHTGAAETRVRLPRAAGMTVARTETGVGSLAIEIPPGVAARIRSTMALGRVDVDAARFVRVADGWESSDYGTAQNRVDLEVKGGVGSVSIR